ncbi:MAG: phage tail protein [Saprospiraceae bacterium]
MANLDEFRPPTSFFFRLSFGDKSDDKQDISFQEASGISHEMSVEEVGCGGENRFKYRLPGVVKYNNLVLKRGLIPKDSKLSKWVVDTIKPGMVSAIETKNIRVSLLNKTGDENSEILISWDFRNAYPVKWSVSDFKAMESELAIETLEFSYDYFEKS